MPLPRKILHHPDVDSPIPELYRQLTEANSGSPITSVNTEHYLPDFAGVQEMKQSVYRINQPGYFYRHPGPAAVAGNVTNADSKRRSGVVIDSYNHLMNSVQHSLTFVKPGTHKHKLNDNKLLETIFDQETDLCYLLRFHKTELRFTAEYVKDVKTSTKSFPVGYGKGVCPSTSTWSKLEQVKTELDKIYSRYGNNGGWGFPIAESYIDVSSYERVIEGCWGSKWTTGVGGRPTYPIEGTSTPWLNNMWYVGALANQVEAPVYWTETTKDSPNVNKDSKKFVGRVIGGSAVQEEFQRSNALNYFVSTGKEDAGSKVSVGGGICNVLVPIVPGICTVNKPSVHWRLCEPKSASDELNQNDYMSSATTPFTAGLSEGVWLSVSNLDYYDSGNLPGISSATSAKFFGDTLREMRRFWRYGLLEAKCTYAFYYHPAENTDKFLFVPIRAKAQGLSDLTEIRSIDTPESCTYQLPRYEKIPFLDTKVNDFKETDDYTSVEAGFPTKHNVYAYRYGHCALMPLTTGLIYKEGSGKWGAQKAQYDGNGLVNSLDPLHIFSDGVGASDGWVDEKSCIFTEEEDYDKNEDRGTYEYHDTSSPRALVEYIHIKVVEPTTSGSREYGAYNRIGTHIRDGATYIEIGEFVQSSGRWRYRLINNSDVISKYECKVEKTSATVGRFTYVAPYGGHLSKHYIGDNGGDYVLMKEGDSEFFIRIGNFSLMENHGIFYSKVFRRCDYYFAYANKSAFDDHFREIFSNSWFDKQTGQMLLKEKFLAQEVHLRAFPGNLDIPHATMTTYGSTQDLVVGHARYGGSDNHPLVHLYDPSRQ